MTSDGRSLVGGGRERHSPLPLDVESRLKFSDSGSAASGEASGDTGLIFVTRRESEEAEPNSVQGGGMITLDSPSNPKLVELWGEVERVMAARQSSVREVMEEFGVADAPPVTDELEEELWQVVEGKTTLMEAADLV